MIYVIREYQPGQDTPNLRECIVELQEFERRIEPALPVGTAMADAYLAYILERCNEYYGKVFVAEVDRRVVGFVCVWDLETGKLIQTLDGHGVCPEVKFSADGRQLAVEDRGEIFIYSTTNWELSQVLEGKDRQIGDWT